MNKGWWNEEAEKEWKKESKQRVCSLGKINLGLGMFLS